jgi:hypothetical protein
MVQTTSYGHDPRVVHRGDGTFDVTTDGGVTYSVRWTDVFDWTVTDPATGQFAQIADVTKPQGFDFAINLPTVDDAIGVLLGPPQQ